MPELGWEGRRQAYLAAIGIPLWTARYPLAHAAITESIVVAALGYEEYGGARVGSAGDDDELPDSPLAETREDAGGGGSAVLSDEGGPLNDGPPLDAYLEDPEILDALARGPQSGRALSRQVLEPARSESCQPVAYQAVAAAPPAAEDLQPVRFQFALFPCGPHALIVPRFQIISPSEEMLLGNILKAMTGARCSPRQFVWPMVSNFAMPQHRRAAGEALGGFLARQAQGLKGFVLLGDHEDDLHALLEVSSSLPVRRQPSLGILLQQPMRKRELWFALIN